MLFIATATCFLTVAMMSVVTSLRSCLDSKMLRPMIEVVKKHSDAVDEKTGRARIRGLYRDLITALIAEDDVAGARQAMREFAAWDRAGLITQCQRILLRLFPRSFAKISRRCLYPIEWRLSRLL